MNTAIYRPLSTRQPELRGSGCVDLDFLGTIKLRQASRIPRHCPQIMLWPLLDGFLESLLTLSIGVEDFDDERILSSILRIYGRWYYEMLEFSAYTPRYPRVSNVDRMT